MTKSTTEPDERAPLFDATRWSLVLRARDKSEAALGGLCQTYRQPLIVWLRARGFSSPDAEDLVQGLFAHLLSRNFLDNVAREKGRFRTFLLRCLKNYIADQHARENAERRGGGQQLESLNAAFEDGDPVHEPPADSLGPDAAYDRAWASSLLVNAFKRLHEECARQGHGALCAELEPVMFNDETASPYREIALRLGMTEAAVKMAASRIRARLRGVVREEILQTVTNEQDLESEIQCLIQMFGK